MSRLIKLFGIFFKISLDINSYVFVISMDILNEGIKDEVICFCMSWSSGFWRWIFSFSYVFAYWCSCSFSAKQFTMEVLCVLKVVPLQLHLNNWASMVSIECESHPLSVSTLLHCSSCQISSHSTHPVKQVSWLSQPKSCLPYTLLYKLKLHFSKS